MENHYTMTEFRKRWIPRLPQTTANRFLRYPVFGAKKVGAKNWVSNDTTDDVIKAIAQQEFKNRLKGYILTPREVIVDSAVMPIVRRTAESVFDEDYMRRGIRMLLKETDREWIHYHFVAHVAGIERGTFNTHIDARKFRVIEDPKRIHRDDVTAAVEAYAQAQKKG